MFVLMKVKKIKYNWRQAGSTIDRDGASEDYDYFTVGDSGVLSIEENIPCNGLEIWNYVVTLGNGKVYRVFNINFVEYFAE